MKKLILLIFLSAVFTGFLFSAPVIPHPNINLERYQNETGPFYTWWHQPDWILSGVPDDSAGRQKAGKLLLAQFDGGEKDLVVFDRQRGRFYVKLNAVAQLNDSVDLGSTADYDFSYGLSDGTNWFEDISVGDFTGDGIDEIFVIYRSDEGIVSSRIGIFSWSSLSGLSGDYTLSTEQDFDHVIYPETYNIGGSEYHNIELMDLDDDGLKDLLIADSGQNFENPQKGAAVYLLRGGDWILTHQAHRLGLEPSAAQYIPGGVKCVIRRPYQMNQSLVDKQRFGAAMAFEPGMDLLALADAYEMTAEFNSGVHLLTLFSDPYIGWTMDVTINALEADFEASHGNVYAFLTQNTGLAGLSYLGYSLDFGDLDRDGIPDLLIGELGNTGHEINGAFYLLSLFPSYPSGYGVTPVTGASPRLIFDVGRYPPVTGVLEYGVSSAVADWDGDGNNDLALGVSYAVNRGDLSATGDFLTGAVYLYFDDDLSLLTGTVSLDTAPQSPLILYGNHGYSYFGNSLWKADLNNDAHPELYCASPGFNSAYDDLSSPPTTGYTGRIYGFLMSAENLLDYVTGAEYADDTVSEGRAIDPNSGDEETPFNITVFYQNIGRLDSELSSWEIVFYAFDFPDWSLVEGPIDFTVPDPREGEPLSRNFYVDISGLPMNSGVFDLHFDIWAKGGEQLQPGFEENNWISFINRSPTILFLPGFPEGRNRDVVNENEDLEFRLDYQDPDGQLPSVNQLWMDWDGDGIIDSGEGYAFLESDPMQGDTTDPKEYWLTVPQEDYAFIFDYLDTHPEVTHYSIPYSIVLCEYLMAGDMPNQTNGPLEFELVFSLYDAYDYPLPTDPVRLELLGEGYPGYINSAVDPHMGADWEDFVFRIRYVNEDAAAELPATHNLLVTMVNPTMGESVSLTFEMEEEDPFDTDVSDGKIYTYTFNEADMTGYDIPRHQAPFLFEFGPGNGPYISYPAFEAGTSLKAVQSVMTLYTVDFTNALLGYNFVDRGKVNLFIPFASFVPPGNEFLMRITPSLPHGDVFPLFNRLFNPDFSQFEEDRALTPGQAFTRFNFLTEAEPNHYFLDFEYYRNGTRINDIPSPTLEVNVEMFAGKSIEPIGRFILENRRETPFIALIHTYDDGSLTMICAESVPGDVWISHDHPDEKVGIFRYVGGDSYDFVGKKSGKIPSSGRFVLKEDRTPPVIQNVFYREGNVVISAEDDLSGVATFMIIPEEGEAIVSEKGSFIASFLREGENRIGVKVSDRMGNEASQELTLYIGVPNPLASGKKDMINYPNPFNPSTRIGIRFDRDERGSLVIMNARQQKVRTLHSGLFEAGIREFEWDGKDERGHVCSSGLYYAVYTGGGRSLVQKMVLVK